MKKRISAQIDYDDACKLTAIIARRVNDAIRVSQGQKPSEGEPGSGQSTYALSKKFEPELCWAVWKAKAEKEGWTYGEEYCKDKKTHPNIVKSWWRLSDEERGKDYAYNAVCVAVHETIKLLGLQGRGYPPNKQKEPF